MTNHLELNSVRFLPWIGSNYHNSGLNGRRILVLGESHYCGECTRKECENDNKSECRDFTIRVVNDYLNRKAVGFNRWMNTFTKFERSLVGDWTDEDSRKSIWDSIAFYNYLQYALDDSRKTGDSDAYSKAIEPFYHVLDYLKPEFIIVWGKQLWNRMPGDERWEEDDSIKMDDGYTVENGYYKLSNGDKAKVFPIYHPSVGYDWNYWHNVINKFIQR